MFFLTNSILFQGCKHRVCVSYEPGVFRLGILRLNWPEKALLLYFSINSREMQGFDEIYIYCITDFVRC